MRFDGLLRALRDDPILAGADVLLLVEVDHGMGRSGNRNVARALAEALGMNYLFAVSYLVLEDDFGENPDRVPNATALAGTAILSRAPIGRAIHVDVPALRDKFNSSERRLGRKRGLAAELLLPDGPLGIVACHLDSNASPRQRATQLHHLLSAGESLGVERLLAGGDFNTTTYDNSSPPSLARDVLHKWFITGFDRTVDNYMTPDLRYELPIFQTLAAHGLSTDGMNDRSAGTYSYDFRDPYVIEKVRRAGSDLLARYIARKLRPWDGCPHARLDWFAGRGLAAGDPRVVRAFDADGRPVSDHAAITIDVHLGSPR
jgi:endonuclease/exonuclease/phosphatase family metal-dependent hydrolase